MIVFIFQGNESIGLDSGNYTYGGVCPKGHFCPAGTRRATDFPCKNGTYNPIYGAKDELKCEPCPGGRVCSAAGLSEPNGYCSPGFYCIKGATYGEPIDGIIGNKCPVGSYCPQNSSTPFICKPGTFRYVYFFKCNVLIKLTLALQGTCLCKTYFPCNGLNLCQFALPTCIQQSANFLIQIMPYVYSSLFRKNYVSPKKKVVLRLSCKVKTFKSN